MLNYIDNIIDKITMYRLVLYVLIAFVCIAGILGSFGLIPFSPISIILSSLFLIMICWASNTVFSKVFKAPTNVESVYITALILTLILSPARTIDDFIFIGWTGLLAMASKYILSINKKHIFNPAAFSVAVTAIALGQYASWWIGTLNMVPFVLVGGLLIIRKLRLEDLEWSFLIVVIALSIVLGTLKGAYLPTTLGQLLFKSPLLFFGFIMLTEPLTMPPTKTLRVFYGGLVGLVFAPYFHIGSIYFSPELALITGNIFSYIVSPKQKLVLKLEQKIQASPDIFDFIFKPNQKLFFTPGQYMEWTLSHPKTDSRGNRRYFTIASSPTENNILLGIRHYENGSSYKMAMINMNDKTPIVASQLAGDFTLPRDQNKKLVFIAGGIGITPFRSMVKYLLDTKQKRSIILLYSNKVASDVVYKDVFDDAEKELGIKTIYTLTERETIPENWQGETGRVDGLMIEKVAPDFKDRVFYLSGPHTMVASYESVLKNMGVKQGNIKKDFFPGYA